VANAVSKDVTLLFGDGQGHFTDQRSLSLGYRFPERVSAADFNQDGHMDLVIANSFPAKLTIILGGDNGQFAEPKDIDVGRWPIVTFAIGNLNGDTLPDLSVLDKSGLLTLICSESDSDFYVLGSHRVSGAGAKNNWGLGLGDFNGDAYTDIALSVENSHSSALRLFLLGEEGMGLNKPTDRAIGQDSIDLHLGDLDLDGKLDAVTVFRPKEGLEPARVGVFRGDGLGEFTEIVYFSLEHSRALPKKLLLADIDNDGDLDAITLNAPAKLPLRFSSSLTILLNTTK
jgi:hypothetical protein